MDDDDNDNDMPFLAPAEGHDADDALVLDEAEPAHHHHGLQQPRAAGGNDGSSMMVEQPAPARPRPPTSNVKYALD